jgi:hypothetical protein
VLQQSFIFLICQESSGVKDHFKLGIALEFQSKHKSSLTFLWTFIVRDKTTLHVICVAESNYLSLIIFRVFNNVHLFLRKQLILAFSTLIQTYYPQVGQLLYTCG